jgi:hypothetical protein
MSADRQHALGRCSAGASTGGMPNATPAHHSRHATQYHRMSSGTRARRHAGHLVVPGADVWSRNAGSRCWGMRYGGACVVPAEPRCSSRIRASRDASFEVHRPTQKQEIVWRITKSYVGSGSRSPQRVVWERVCSSPTQARPSRCSDEPEGSAGAEIISGMTFSSNSSWIRKPAPVTTKDSIATPKPTSGFTRLRWPCILAIRQGRYPGGRADCGANARESV